jgi:hypothetical protein
MRDLDLSPTSLLLEELGKIVSISDMAMKT